MLEKFAAEAQKLIAIAESLAFDLSQPFIGREHVFLAFLKTKESFLTMELKKYHLTYEAAMNEWKKRTTPDPDDVYFMEYTTSLKVMLDRAIALSHEWKEERVSPEALAYALLQEEEGIVDEILKQYKVNRKEILQALLKSNKRRSDLEQLSDLHELSKVKRDPLIGRQPELDQLIRALKRRNKPNALLVGAPGIGKTAIVEELSQLLAQNKIHGLENKRIYELDLSGVVGGTKYRGEFEEKLKKIIRKVKDDGNAILFVDEIHNIVKAGGAEGAIDASNILKPYLSRGEIQMIGATTIDEYHATIEKDKALNRRFQIIKVDPSTARETQEIMHALRPLYEEHYHIKIPTELINYIVEVANEYLPSRCFPDKAIDLLDNACVIAQEILRREDIHQTMESFYHVTLQIKNKAEVTYRELKSAIFGQDVAVGKVYRWLQMLERGIRVLDKPLAVLFFAGPSGVGKSETAKVIAKTFLQNEEAFIRLDMSQFQDAASIHKLTGSPPGYAGHDQKTTFMKRVQAHPNAVVLLDEMDKAHVDVCDFFLNVFDEGFFYDIHQEKVDCSNMMFIMTSNLGFDQSLLFSKRLHEHMVTEHDIAKRLSSRFRTEFLNRIDEIIVFDYLGQSAKEAIVSKYRKELNNVHSMELSAMLDEVQVDIDEEDFTHYGARSVRRAMLQKIAEYFIEKEKMK